MIIAFNSLLVATTTPPATITLANQDLLAKLETLRRNLQLSNPQGNRYSASDDFTNFLDENILNIFPLNEKPSPDVLRLRKNIFEDCIKTFLHIGEEFPTCILNALRYFTKYDPKFLKNFRDQNPGLERTAWETYMKNAKELASTESLPTTFTPAAASSGPAPSNGEETTPPPANNNQPLAATTAPATTSAPYTTPTS